MNLFPLLILSGVIACFTSCSMPTEEGLATKLEDFGFEVELEDGYINILEGDCGKFKGDVENAILSQLKHVKTAVLENIDADTLSKICKWNELEKLELKSCKLDRLEEIGQLSSLKSFSLESKLSVEQIDVQFLKLLPKLRRIYLKGKAINNFEVISLGRLRGLRFEGTGISDFSFLRQCQGLRGLVVKTNQMKVNLSGISKLTKLDGLVIHGPIAVDFPINSNLFKLEINGVSRFTDDIGLERMSNLISLTVKNTKVVFGANSFRLPGNIQNLSLEAVPNQDLRVLSKLKNLNSLHVPVEGIADGSSGFDSLSILGLNSKETTGVIGFGRLRRLSIFRTSIAVKDLSISKFPELVAIGLNSKQHSEFESIRDNLPGFNAEIRLID